MEQKGDNKRKDITKVILVSIAVVGITSMAVLAPNTLQALAIFQRGNKKASKYKYYLPRAISRLERQGYICFEKSKKGTFVRLTQKGKERVAAYELEKYDISVPKRWDGKYRIVTFDIKEYKRYIRDRLREHLENVGFVRLQNSVWVYPYDCSEFIALLKADRKSVV